MLEDGRTDRGTDMRKLVVVFRYFQTRLTYLYYITVRGSNPGGGEIFRTRPDRPWGLQDLLHNGYQFLPGGKAVGAWR